MNKYLESLKKEILPNNKRSDFLIRILEKRINDPAKDLYIEIHHIFPESWGGPNDNNNLVSLSGGEHFKVHQLLHEVTINKEKQNSMTEAYWFMSHLNKYKIKNHKEYHKLREKYSSFKKEQLKEFYKTEKGLEVIENKKKKMQGKNNPMYNVGMMERLVGKYKNEEIVNKRYESWIKKQSINSTGRNNPMYGLSAYKIWIEKYGKDEADLMEKERNKKHSKSISGEKNPMHGKSVYNVWVERYGIEEANLRQIRAIEKGKKTRALKKISI